MDYQTITVWTIVKRFIFGWLTVGALIVVISCIKYKEFIFAVFKNNIWAWINTGLPIAIMVIGIGYILKAMIS